MLKLILMAFIVSSCSYVARERNPSSSPRETSWRQYVDQNVFQKEGLDRFFTDPEYLELPWKPNSDFVMNKPLRPFQIQEKAFSCRSRKVWPTHPSQGTKDYLYAVYANYQHHKTPPNSSGCLLKNPTGRYCLRSATAVVVVMTDTFEDECGNYYRGYWLVTYLKSDESMGTLFSKGRTAYPKPNSEFANDYIEGGTYYLDPENFLLLGNLQAGDMAKINTERSRALKYGFKRQGKAFVR